MPLPYAQTLTREVHTGERSLFHAHDLNIVDSTFLNGESPLKESQHLAIESTSFQWKYPLWYCTDIELRNCALLDTARSGIWYTSDIRISDSLIAAPKTFRRSQGITLTHVDMPNALESLWSCTDVTMHDVSAQGDYFAMNCHNLTAHNLRLTGNYAFDGGRNIEIHDAILLSKDAFWNCENVTVYNSTIVGEYLGWNSKNLTFINCTIESLQGLCYIDNLVLRDCRLINTTLAFEYSTVAAHITGRISSVLNPRQAHIQCEGIDELILDPDKIDPTQTVILNPKATS
ncbi:DUF3737 family protein [Trueperella sp. LYQ143]|uniref:DUF3737 family protein n=1 Tax=unclassified Trueperella TaxID=2630174 RepID=UPI003983B3A8